MGAKGCKFACPSEIGWGENENETSELTDKPFILL